jgi:hypothetical protein
VRDGCLSINEKEVYPLPSVSLSLSLSLSLAPEANISRHSGFLHNLKYEYYLGRARLQGRATTVRIR